MVEFLENDVREFDTGATRDNDSNKFDYEGFLSPIVLDRFAEYMHKHRRQADGQLRDSDNWQKGIPMTAYMKSMCRHFMDVWRQHRGYQGQDTREDSLCALLFNVMGYLHETLKARPVGAVETGEDDCDPCPLHPTCSELIAQGHDITPCTACVKELGL